MLIVIRLPSEYFQRDTYPHHKEEMLLESRETNDLEEIKGKLVACKYCGWIFEVNGEEQATQISCPHCGQNKI